MRYRPAAFGLMLAVALAVVLDRGDARAQSPPLPRRASDDDGDGFSPADFERILQKLKAEREGLSSDWQALRKRNTTPELAIEVEQKRFEMQMQKVLDDLKKRHAKRDPAVAAEPDPVKTSTDHDAVEDKKPGKVAPLPEANAEKAAGPVDGMAQAHSLMRSKQYEEALAAFQQVDLKGKKTSERAPIQYLKAWCLLHLGKSKDASELLQEVANYHGDEKLAGYAQAQLELLRWQRDIAQKLEDIRQREKAVEASR